MNKKFGAETIGEYEVPYFGMRITQYRKDDSASSHLNSNSYDGKINDIAISKGRRKKGDL